MGAFVSGGGEANQDADFFVGLEDGRFRKPRELIVQTLEISKPTSSYVEIKKEEYEMGISTNMAKRRLTSCMYNTLRNTFAIEPSLFLEENAVSRNDPLVSCQQRIFVVSNRNTRVRGEERC